MKCGARKIDLESTPFPVRNQHIYKMSWKHDMHCNRTLGS
jgi:hypothetical protein